MAQYPSERKRKSWTVQNHALWETMQKNNIVESEMASLFGVSVRTVQRWVYEGAAPKEGMAMDISSTMNMPLYELFPEVSLNNGKKKSTRINYE